MMLCVLFILVTTNFSHTCMSVITALKILWSTGIISQRESRKW